MTYHVILRPAANKQVDVADQWWRQNRPAAPNLFALELEEAFGILGDAPEIGVSFLRRGVPGLRRLLLRRSRYHIYYVHEGDEVQVLAVWSAVRRRTPPLR